MDDRNRRVDGRVGRQLVHGAQIDRRADAVVEQRLPAALRQAADRVRADDDAEARLTAAFERQPAEIPNVDAAVPDEDAVAGQGSEVLSRP